MRSLFAQRLKNAVWLGLLSSSVAFLYLGHQVHSPWEKVIVKRFGTHQAAFEMFIAEFLFAAISVFICSGVGFLLSARYKLPGMGDIRQVPRYVPLFLLMSLLLIPVPYLLHDRAFIVGARDHGWVQMMPQGVGWSCAFIAYSVLFKEVMIRFGFLTLVAGFFRGRHPWWAVGGTAAFAAGLSMKDLTFAGHLADYDFVTFTTFLWALLFNFALGTVYIRKGLWASMTLRACIELRFVIYALIGCFKLVTLP